MDEVTQRLFALWQPAARRAADLIARRYRATAQERADLHADAPTALWCAAHRGWLSLDTPKGLAITILCRCLIGNQVGDVKAWRPNAYRSIRDGKRYWRTHPMHSFTDTALRLHDAGAVHELTISPSQPSDRVAILAALFRYAEFTQWQRIALAGLLRGELRRETDARFGRGNGCANGAVREAIVKLRAAGCDAQLIELLS